MCKIGYIVFFLYFEIFAYVFINYTNYVFDLDESSFTQFLNITKTQQLIYL